MTLKQKQFTFAKLVARLIDKAIEMGYNVALGECYRSPEEAARLAKLGVGIENSLHTLKLAIDLLLFKGNDYLTKTADYEQLGKWWEAQSAVSFHCCWGGRFGDGDHFSIEHNGVK